MKKEVTTTYLEMLSQKDFKPKKLNRNDVRVTKVEIPAPTLNHYFFVNVGRPWKWYSRLKWTYKDWKTWAAREGVTTWVGYMKGTPIGYIELDQRGTDIELSSFGLLPQFIGQGLGGFFLSEAIRLAWKLQPKRVWVHTCTLDHKYALNNYQARGFSIYKKETRIEQIPDDDNLAWSTPQFYASLTDEYALLKKQTAEYYSDSHNNVPK